MRNVLSAGLLAALFTLTLAPIVAAATDPYADEVNKETIRQYKIIRQSFADRAEKLYFAVGCKVFSETTIAPLYNAYAAVVEQEALRDRILDQSGSLRKAAQAGLQHAGQDGACDYWHKHPNEIVELRRLALAAAP